MMDDWLIDKIFQPMSDRLARIASCYSIAAFLLTGFGLEQAIIMFFIPYSWLLLISLAWFPKLLIRAHRLEASSISDAIPAERINNKPGRTLDILLLTPFIVLGLVLSSWTSRLTSIAWLAMIAAEYFMACRRLPPKRAAAPHALEKASV